MKGPPAVRPKFVPPWYWEHENKQTEINEIIQEIGFAGNFNKKNYITI